MYSRQWNQICVLIWTASPFCPLTMKLALPVSVPASPLPPFPACIPVLLCSCRRISQETGLQQEEIEVKTEKKKDEELGERQQWLEIQKKCACCSLNHFSEPFPQKRALWPASAFQREYSKEGWLRWPLLVKWREEILGQQSKIPFLFGNSVSFPVYPVCLFPGLSLSFGAFPPKVTCLNPHLPAALQSAEHGYY